MKQNIVLKIVLIMVAGLAAIFYLILLGGSTYEAVVFPQSPQNVTLTQAVEMELQNKPEFLFFDKALYVSITDAVWECASVKQVDAYNNIDEHTEAVFSNGNKDALVFVRIEGLYTCRELQEMEIAGKLQRFTERPVQYESDTDGTVTLDEASETITLELITHGTPSEARLYPIFFLGLPFVIWGMFVYTRCQRQQGVV
jgi:hypothetical protein